MDHDCETPEGDFRLLNGAVVLERGFILDNAYLAPGDAAIVAGSLIEGIGNVNSDVDVYVLTDRRRRAGEIAYRQHFRAFGPNMALLTGQDPDAEVFLLHTVIPGEKIKVDIEYRTWAELDDLVARVDGLFQVARGSIISLLTSLDRRSLALVHRLHNSRTIRDTPALTRLGDRLSKAKFTYLLYRWKGSDYSVLLDMQGAWDDGDLIRCADMARENMVTQFHAYTHLCGNTSYNRKWIITYAKRLNVEGDLLEQYLDLLTCEIGRTDARLRAYILATLDLVDEIFAACSRRLEAQPLYPSGPAALAALEQFKDAAAGDYSETEIAYCKKAYGVPGNPTRHWFP